MISFIFYQGYNLYFWENVLSDEDRKELASHGIKSCKESHSSPDKLLTIIQSTISSQLMKPPRHRCPGHLTHWSAS